MSNRRYVLSFSDSGEFVDSADRAADLVDTIVQFRQDRYFADRTFCLTDSRNGKRVQGTELDALFARLNRS